MVQSREPLVDDVIGFMDGASIPAECTDERFEQNVLYCGYDCDTMVNNMFAYGPDGKVFFCSGTFPWKLGRRRVDGENSTHNQKKN